MVCDLSKSAHREAQMRRMLRPILVMIFVAATVLAPAVVTASAGGQVLADVPIGGGPPPR